jgi:predicted metal-binding membrane protein
MTHGTQRPPLLHLPGRDRLIILTCIVALTALAWAYLLHLDRQMAASMADAIMMAEMGMPMDEPWTRTDVLLAFAMWAVMMTGMMTPSATPVILLAANAGAARGQRAIPGTALAFAAGYLLVWSAFSLIAALAQWALHEAAMLSPAMRASSPQLAGAILIGAGIYQVTPLKIACLTHCRSPLDFLVAHWRSGVAGAVRMGAHHGLYCLGCCWALMAVLFAAGIMNLAWVAVIAVFVLVEKLAPASAVISRVAGAAMIIAGLATIFWLV